MAANIAVLRRGFAPLVTPALLLSLFQSQGWGRALGQGGQEEADAFGSLEHGVAPGLGSRWVLQAPCRLLPPAPRRRLGLSDPLQEPAGIWGDV